MSTISDILPNITTFWFVAQFVPIHYHYRWMTSHVDEGIIRSGRRMPEDDLRDGKIMNVADSR